MIIDICIGENLLVGISIGSVAIFQYLWNTIKNVQGWMCTNFLPTGTPSQ